MTDDQTTDEWLAGLETADDVEVKDASDLRSIGASIIGIESAERALLNAVAKARTAGRSWTEIGNVLGVSRQAARQRFGEALASSRDAQPGDTLIVEGSRDVFIVGALAAVFAASPFVKEGTDVSDVEAYLARVAEEHPDHRWLRA